MHAGVCIRVTNNDGTGQGQFRVFPYENRYLEPFEAAVRALNPVVAVKVRSAAIHAALSCVYVFIFIITSTSTDIPISKEDDEAIYVDNDTRIQILETMSWLPRADKEQRGAFIVSSVLLLPVLLAHFWACPLDAIVHRAETPHLYIRC